MKRKLLTNIMIIAGYIVMVWWLYIEKKEADVNGRKKAKFEKYYQVFDKWIGNINKNISCEMLLKDMGIRTIAIYGNGEVGCRLAESLISTSVEIKCIIEKKADDFSIGLSNGIKVVGIKEVSEYSQVDAIIVTPVFDYEMIEKELLGKKVSARIISIEDVVFSGMNVD